MKATYVPPPKAEGTIAMELTEAEARALLGHLGYVASITSLGETAQKLERALVQAMACTVRIV